MKKLIFALTLLLASNAFAATGTGHSQAELTQPLRIVTSPVDFGVISIDPAAGAQTYELGGVCPPGYLCTGTLEMGTITVFGAPNTEINLSIEGEIAILSDGAGNTISFDPTSGGVDSRTYTLPPGGSVFWNIGGVMSFTGNEVAGTYNTTNAGGSGYQVTVNY